MDPRVARLIDRQEIRDVLHSYCRGIDRGDIQRVRDCYHPDARDDHGSFEGSVDAFVEWVGALLARYVSTFHFIGNVLIEFGEAPDLASVESYGISLHRSDPNHPDDRDKAHLNLANGFRYLDRFERRDGLWKIGRRQAVAEWSVHLPQDIWWELPETLTQGQRDGSDAIYALLSHVGVRS